MATCTYCPGETIPDAEVLAHVQALHPDIVAGGVDAWPDGELAVEDQTADTPADAVDGTTCHWTTCGHPWTDHNEHGCIAGWIYDEHLGWLEAGETCPCPTPRPTRAEDGEVPR